MSGRGFVVAIIVLLIAGGLAFLAHRYAGTWKPALFTIIGGASLMMICCGYPMAEQSSRTDLAAQALASQYNLVDVSAPLVGWQTLNDVSTPYSQRETGWYNTYINANNGYVKLRKENPPEQFNRTHRLPTDPSYCLAFFGLWEDDDGWYLVLGSGEVIEGVCPPNLDDLLVPRKIRAFGSTKKSERPEAPKGVPGVFSLALPYPPPSVAPYILGTTVLRCACIQHILRFRMFLGNRVQPLPACVARKLVSH